MQTRRGFLWWALNGVGAFNLPNILRLRAEAAAPHSRRNTSLIVLWQDGGPSHFETFDPKPDAPAEIRGDLRTIATRHPGIEFCEVLPRLASLSDRFTIIRSLHQASSAHVSATHTFITGFDRTGVISGPPDNPDLAVVINRIRSTRSGGRRNLEEDCLPTYVGLPGMSRGGSAYLGSAYGPFHVNDDPSKPEFAVKNLQPSDSVPAPRFRERSSLLERLDGLRRDVDATGRLSAMDDFQQQAFGMITGSAAAKAFDLSQEDEQLRERYGMHKAGQQCLLARRLVETGVSVVGVRFQPPGPWHDSWDDHPCGTHVFGTMKGRGPLMDQAVSALVEDLASRGLDERVLVLLAGEFGRTPRIRNFNGVPGRDHWGPAGCALLYGGGLRMGQVIGATNKLGEHPAERPIKPQDILATIYRFMGINPRHEFISFSGRPLPLLPHGEPIRELIVPG
jgi:hypothetical protein